MNVKVEHMEGIESWIEALKSDHGDKLEAERIMIC